MLHSTGLALHQCQCLC